MQRYVFSKSSFNVYLIPILLLVCSFVIYSYSLEGGRSHGDEIIYLGWGGPYFDLILQGDFDNPCLVGLKNCELLFDPDWEGHNINYSPIRNFFIGFGIYLTTGEIKGDFYEWSCMFMPCWDLKNYPSPEEFASGRFFSPVFGSLTVVLAFFIGKILFNRNTGLFFSLSLLFFNLWILTSRRMMSEVYLHFFIILTIFLLLTSFKKENNQRRVYFILAAISFGLAFNVKLFAVELVIPIALMIIFYDSFNKKLNFGFFKNRKNVLRAVTLVLMFFLISSITFVATVPRYHDNTIDSLLDITRESEAVGWASLPNSEKNYLFQTLATFQATLIPYLMDSFIHDVFPDEANKVRLQEPKTVNHHLTIPLSLFFFIGLIAIIRKIKIRNLKFSEFTILVWFTCVFIFMILIVDFPNFVRYYLTAFFPILLIASYALGEFTKKIQNPIEKILFFMTFIIAHSLYAVVSLDKIYFAGSGARLGAVQTFFTTGFVLNEPIVYVSSITFVLISFLIFIRMRMKTSPKHDEIK